MLRKAPHEMGVCLGVVTAARRTSSLNCSSCFLAIYGDYPPSLQLHTFQSVETKYLRTPFIFTRCSCRGHPPRGVGARMPPFATRHPDAWGAERL